MIKAPPRIANAARARVATCMGQIRKSAAAIAEGRPGEAEPETTRREQVYQARTGSSLETAHRMLLRSGEGQERIFGKTIDFVDVAFFERGRRAARAVGRIITLDGAGIGTSFLISPRLLMTNNHVIGNKSSCAGLLVEFDYERDVQGTLLKVTRYTLAPEFCFLTNDQDDLDYTVVALGERVMGEKSLTDFGYLPVSNARNKHQLGDLVNIIQHPDTRPKEAVLRENQLVARNGTTLHYLADTEPGSSGSPVFNVQFVLVALHHWGTPHRELTDEKGKLLPKTVNEGIRASSIFSDLTTLRSSLEPGSRAFIDEALQLGLDNVAPAVISSDSESTYRSNAAMASVEMSDDGVATWNIPLTVSIRVGDRAAARRGDAARANSGAVFAIKPSEEGSEAKLELDPDYTNRDGYDPEFLGKIAIPLPNLSPSWRKIAARNSEARAGDNPYELKYYHSSVIMNGKRRLAFVSAVNIDGSTSKDFNRLTGTISDPFAGDGEEASELWFPEGRIRPDQQTPRDFYQGQTTFDAHGNRIVDKKTGGQHVNRMFQQGHLTRRQDPLWGNDEDLIRYANADTFHVTNCAPQVGFFNMGIAKSTHESLSFEAKTKNKKTKKTGHPGGEMYWRALEEYVLRNARADRQKVSVFTGPIFDDENDIEWDRGRTDMKGFKAPREFWKLVLRVHDDTLQATALIADQSPLIDYLPELVVRGEGVKGLPYEKIAHYHVSLPFLETRTDLDFGTVVRKADTFVARGRGESSRLRLITTINDVALTRATVRRKTAKAGTSAKKRPKPKAKRKGRG